MCDVGSGELDFPLDAIAEWLQQNISHKHAYSLWLFRMPLFRLLTQFVGLASGG